MSWYANWFDTHYYHLLYQHRDEAEAERFVKNISTKFPSNKYPYLCDAACGKGRHAIHFAELGYQVDAFDLSANSIQIAQEKGGSQVNFFVHDILEPFVHDKYDLVTNLFTSFGYFETDLHDVSALNNIAESLKFKGYFVQDYLNAMHVKPDSKWQKTVREGVTFRTKKEIKDGKVRKSIEVLDQGKKHEFKEEVKLYNFESFKQLYSIAGLEIVDVYGDYSFNKFEEDESPRLILISQKAR